MSIMTERLFEHDAYAKTASAVIVDLTDDAIILDQTIFYAASGGQPGDLGLMTASDGRTVQITDTQYSKPDKTILHFVDRHDHGFNIGECVRLSINWPAPLSPNANAHGPAHYERFDRRARDRVWHDA